MFIPKINECSNCGMGFKDSENNSDSCMHHEKEMLIIDLLVVVLNFQMLIIQKEMDVKKAIM